MALSQGLSLLPKGLPVRHVYISAGLALVALGVLIAPLPGPGGLPVVMAGTVVLLRHSPWARKRWVMAKRRWPQVLGRVDGMMRARKRAARSTPSAD